MNRAKSNRVLYVLAVIGAAFFIVINWWPAFTGEPAEQSSDIAPPITKAEAGRAAREFVSAHFSARSMDSFVIYQTDKQLSGYVQKQDLYESYSRQYISEYPIDYFQAEVVDKETDARYWVDIHMDSGRIFGWSKVSDNTQTDRESGGKLADSMIAQMGYDPDQFSIVNDTDISEDEYVYEHVNERIGEAKLQLHIEVADGEVVAFHPVFAPPPSFASWFEKQDSTAQIMSLISLLISAIMAVTAIVFTALYRQSISFSRGIILTLVFTVAYCINNISMYPGFKAMAAGGPESGFAGMFTVAFANFIIFLMAAGLYLSLISGDALWRHKGVDLWPQWSSASFGRQVVSGMGKGYLVCLFILGIQAILFFIAERYFHVWSINDPSSSPYNMLWPSLFPLMAWAAAISEEGIFRLFGIIVFKKLTRSTFLGVLIPSMFWALGHTSYPIYPVYTRFVEVTILGILFGYAMIKYGLITAIFAHAVMDSILMGFSLMSLGQVSDILTGLFYIALPALVALLIYWLHRRFPKAPVPDRLLGAPQ